jgi:predicted dehydrogenase
VWAAFTRSPTFRSPALRFVVENPAGLGEDRTMQCGQPSTRRQFLVTSALTAAAGSLARGGGNPSDRVRIGMIGLGGMGMSRLQEFLKLPDVEVAAVCDVDREHRDRAVQVAEQRQGRKPQAFGDFRRLLELADVDAVAVVTPDHWHSIPVIQACRAGKDVFVEKPLSYSVEEGRAMVSAARSAGRVTQMGNHIHNDLPNYRRVVEQVRSGNLGRITRVHCWKTSSLRSLGSPPDSRPPAGLDYDIWLGPAPQRPYNPLRSHGTYRYFWDYSGGVFIDFWCHIVDLAYWALDLEVPLNVSAAGTKRFLDDATETPDTMEAVLEYPDLTLLFTLHPDPLPGFSHLGAIGCVFQGTEALLAANYETHEIYVKGKREPEFPRPEPSIPDSPGHLAEFVQAIRSRNTETTCNLDYGHRLTKAGLLANIACRTGERLYWDDEREQFEGNEEACRLLGRTFRRPWTLEG